MLDSKLTAVQESQLGDAAVRRGCCLGHSVRGACQDLVHVEDGHIVLNRGCEEHRICAPIELLDHAALGLFLLLDRVARLAASRRHAQHTAVVVLLAASWLALPTT